MGRECGSEIFVGFSTGWWVSGKVHPLSFCRRASSEPLPQLLARNTVADSLFPKKMEIESTGSQPRASAPGPPSPPGRKPLIRACHQGLCCSQSGIQTPWDPGCLGLYSQLLEPPSCLPSRAGTAWLTAAMGWIMT